MNVAQLIAAGLVGVPSVLVLATALVGDRGLWIEGASGRSPNRVRVAAGVVGVALAAILIAALG